MHLKANKRRAVAVPHAAGAAMSQLTPVEQKFVEFLVHEPCMGQADALTAAGYNGGYEATRKHAYRLLHDPVIRQAREEVAKAELVGLGPLTVPALETAARNPHHRGHKKASEAILILNRTGHMPTIKVGKHTTNQVTHILDRSQIIAAITDLVERNKSVLPPALVTHKP